MSGGDDIEQKQSTLSVEANIQEKAAQAQSEANQGFLADAYDWAGENPLAATAIGVAAVAGAAYLTRGKWMPAVTRFGAATEAATARAAGKTVAFDATQAGLTAFGDAAATPGMQAWRGALSYADVGLDKAGSLIYRGAKAGAFVDDVLVVSGQQEAGQLFRAISREGLLQRGIWERGAAGATTELAEVTLPGKTRFLFAEGRTVELGAGGKLIDLKTGEFNALAADAAQKMYKGLSMF